MAETSVKYSLNKEEQGRAFKGLLIATGGAALTYIAQWILATDFGPYTPMAVAVLSAGVNLAREWLKGQG